LKIIGPSVASIVSFKIWVDRDFPNAKFVVICDRPCVALEAHIDWNGHEPKAGMKPDADTATLPDVPDSEKLAAFLVYHPEVFGPDVTLVGAVKSSDGTPLRIIGVKPLTITPPH
jgi:hypothetical protein